MRARRAGFELAVALDVFVHHFGSRTFAGNGIDAERLLEENARRFAEKWGHDRRRRGGGSALRPWVPSAAGGTCGERSAESGVRSRREPWARERIGGGAGVGSA